MSKDGTTPEAPVEARRLTRSKESRIITGVCAGLGHYTRIDPVVYRVGFAVLVLATGMGIILYLAAFVLMSGDDGRDSIAEQILRRRFDGDTVLTMLGALFAFGLLLSVAGDGLSGNALAAVTLFALVLIVAHARGVDLVQVARGLPERLQNRTRPPGTSTGAPSEITLVTTTQGVPEWTGGSGHTTADPASNPTSDPTSNPAVEPPPGFGPEPAAGPREGMVDLARLGHQTRDYRLPGGFPPTEEMPSRQRRRARERSLLSPLTLLTALIVAAGMMPVAVGYPAMMGSQIVLASALAVIGLGLVIATWFGRGRGLVAAGTALSIALVSTSIAGDVSGDGGRIGDVNWRPVDVTQLQSTYRLKAGDGTLDLSALRMAPGQRVRVRAEVTLGELRVTVPPTARVELLARSALGDITVDERITSGPGARVDEVLEPESRPEGRRPGPAPTIELSLRGTVGDLGVTRA